jgi:hypothetical protein
MRVAVRDFNQSYMNIMTHGSDVFVVHCELYVSLISARDVNLVDH